MRAHRAACIGELLILFLPRLINRDATIPSLRGMSRKKSYKGRVFYTDRPCKPEKPLFLGVLGCTPPPHCKDNLQSLETAENAENAEKIQIYFSSETLRHWPYYWLTRLSP